MISQFRPERRQLHDEVDHATQRTNFALHCLQYLLLPSGPAKIAIECRPRTRVLQQFLATEALATFREIHVNRAVTCVGVIGIVNLLFDANSHATWEYGIHRLFKSDEIYAQVIIDDDAQILRDRILRQTRATTWVIACHAQFIGGIDSSVGKTRDRHPQIARQREHRRRLPRRIHRDEHHRICIRRGDGVYCTALVDAHQQDGDAPWVFPAGTRHFALRSGDGHGSGDRAAHDCRSGIGSRVARDCYRGTGYGRGGGHRRRRSACPG